MGQRLFYATPTGKHPHPGYVTSMRDIEMSMASFDRRPEDFAFACGPVQMARSEIAERACRGVCNEKHVHGDEKSCKRVPYDYLLMHDDDLIVNAAGPLGNPVDAWHAIFEANPDVGVIGGVYLRENMETPTIVMSHPVYPEENCHAVAGMPFGAFPVSGIGTGFMMIRVSALAKLREKEDGAHSLFQFPFNRNRWGSVNHSGEDYDFCARMRGIGYKVLADSRFETAHIKESGTLNFHHATYEAGFSDKNPNIMERLTRLRKAVVAGVVAIKVDGIDCLDHTPVLIAEANEYAEKRAAKATKKEAA